MYYTTSIVFIGVSFLTHVYGMCAAGTIRCTLEVNEAHVYDIPLSGINTSKSENNFTALGISAMEAKDYHLAVKYFTASTRWKPYSGGVFTNLSSALLKLATQIVPDSALILLCEAESAAKLALHLSGKEVVRINEANVIGGSQLLLNIQKKLQKLQTFLLNKNNSTSVAATQCSELKSSNYWVSQQNKLDDSLLLEQNGRHIEAVNFLCKHKDDVWIYPTQAERKRKIFTASSLRAIWVLQRICGVFAIKRNIDTTTITNVHEAVESHWRSKQTKIEKMKSDSTYVSSNLARRGTFRWEVTLPLSEPFTDIYTFSS